MDLLRSPGGCPWDAAQTHASLVPYAIEEVHEVVEAIESGDREDLREELGDLLLQVVFHARVAKEHPEEPFGIAEVAAGITAKLRRRHPHVFEVGEAREGGSGDAPAGSEDQHARWERIKKTEKNRASVLDGIPAGLPALARAQKVLSRASRAGLETGGPGREVPGGAVVADAGDQGEAELGARILALVAEAHERGLDAEGALRGAVRRLEGELRRAEQA
ncbi:MazG family protein [Actinotalea sp. BY-33]|uniref:MazG family protein n=2 Tax=Actinotalea soli TaxID=2819234 RepID=A0A939LTR2_9CELL|nr:MazG family protein [Actinotalea soli]